MAVKSKQGVWFLDFTLQKKFFYGVPKPKLVQVFHLRKFCERRESFQQYCKRGRGFLKLTLGSQELVNDTDYFFKTFKYPKNLGAASPPTSSDKIVVVAVRVTKMCELSFDLFTHKILCHMNTDERFFRQILSRRFLVTSNAITFLADKQSSQTKIMFVTPNYIPISLELPQLLDTILFPRFGTVRDFISMVQYNYFFAKHDDEPVPRVRVSVGGSELGDDATFINQCAVKCTTGEAISATRTFCCCTFESGFARQVRLFDGCSMSFARYAISMSASLPFENVALFKDAAYHQPVDLGQKMSGTLYMRAPMMLVHFTGPKRPFAAKFPLSDRVFEVRRKVSKIMRENFHKIQLVLGHFCLEDDCHISMLGLSEQDRVQINLLPVGLVHLYFVDLDGRRAYFTFPAEGRTFGSLANLFAADAPMEIQYKQGGRAVKRSTRIDEVICDPHLPIVVMPRALTVPVIFEHEPKINIPMPVTLETDVNDVIEFVHKLYPGVIHMVLRVGGDEVKKGKKLTEVNPELEEPIIVAKIARKGEKRFVIELIPTVTGEVSSPVKYIRSVAVNLNQATKVRDLLTYLTTHMGLGPIKQQRVSHTGRSVGLDNQLKEFGDDSKLTVSYAHPDVPLRYEFVLTGWPARVEVQEVRSSTRVFDQKVALLRAWGHEHVLPGAFPMMFWDVELKDSRCLMNYGLPDGTRIELTLKKAETIWVDDLIEYHFSERDTIGSLLRLLALERGGTIQDLGLRILLDGEELSRGQLLKDLPAHGIRLATRAPRIQLSSFERIKDIGHGVFGDVYQVKDRQTGALLAMKIVKKVEGSEKDDLVFAQDIWNSRSVDHETLLCLRGYVPLNAENGDPPAILTDYVGGGSLGELLDQERRKGSRPALDEVQRLIVLFGISIGMLILRRNGIIHGDLKPNNVLLNEALEPKVADFALSRFVDVRKGGDIGTLMYQAPEVLEGSPCEWDVDVYAYGILVYTTITKLVPYAGTEFGSSHTALRSEVIRGTRPDLPDNLDVNWLGLIERCWNRDPEVRPTWEWICQQLGGLSFVCGLTEPGVSKFKEYRQRVSPPDLVFSDARAPEKIFRSSWDSQPGALPRYYSGVWAAPQFDDHAGLGKSLLAGRPSDPNTVRLTSVLLAKVVPLSAPGRSVPGMVKDFKSMPEKGKLGDAGAVKLVEDPGNRTLIALKSIMLMESPAGDRFMEEFEPFARLVHPCVLEIVGYSLAMNDHTAIIGTNFAVGGSLKDAMEQRRLNDTEIAIVVCGIVLGMRFVHSHDIVHQNLKPSNVLLDERGYARIGDAWLARLLDLDIAAMPSSSPVYMSPEMYEEKQGKPADVYSFALILYELLVRQPVFDPRMVLGILMKQVTSGVRPRLPESMNPAVREIIERGWSVDSALRPSFDDIWRCLERINFQLTGRVDSSKVLEFTSWVRTSAPDSIPVCNVAEHSYAFLAPQKGPELFSLRCEDDATVGVVREKIAGRLEALPEDVQLLFGGRILRDSLILVNLQISDGDVIIIFIRELTELRF